MSKNKAIAVMSLAILLVTNSFLNSKNCVSVSAMEAVTEEAKISVAYEYPIVPGMAEWKQLNTHAKKIDACQIPEDILKNLTTEALVETVMNYPLLVDMLAYNTQFAGYQAVYNGFNGLRELQTREDAVECMENYQSKVSLLNEVDRSTLTNDFILMDVYVEGIITGLEASYEMKNLMDNAKDGSVWSMIIQVLTPKGTSVATIYNKDWDEAMNTSAELTAAQTDILNTYDVELISPYNIKYNCHSYAWHNSSTSNLQWMNDPSAYMSDGSYYQSISGIGARIFYDSGWGSSWDHSGVVVSAGSSDNNNVYVYSKWGEHGLYKHTVYECPYADYSPTIRYYMLND